MLEHFLDLQFLQNNLECFCNLRYNSVKGTLAEQEILAVLITLQVDPDGNCIGEDEGIIISLFRTVLDLGNFCTSSD